MRKKNIAYLFVMKLNDSKHKAKSDSFALSEYHILSETE